MSEGTFSQVTAQIMYITCFSLSKIITPFNLCIARHDLENFSYLLTFSGSVTRSMNRELSTFSGAVT